ncbi:MAG TPA: M1 family peptidase, partial [Planctomycetes bacterium]|nr:M1 family peptidase [Planctomycetota bacterium]
MKRSLLALPFLLLLALGTALGGGDGRSDRFRQMEDLLPTPGPYRTASGAPGHEYWQQRVDYSIEARLDEAERSIDASETITYHNNSPDRLAYLWVQIDPNIFSPESHAVTTSLAPDLGNPTFSSLQRVVDRTAFDGSAEITSVRTLDGEEIPHTVVGTMMRVDLPEPLEAGSRTTFSIDWNYRINDHDRVGGRTGYEYFEKDDNAIFEIAQWFPRMAAYTDVTGWQHKQFLGRGEFTLEFGDYHVELTVPSDHIVAATGELQNPADVLTQTQRDRLEDAADDTQVFIVTPEEALANQDSLTEGTKTWIFDAKNVRDFSWASSRKFIWDARRHRIEGGREVLAMSYYPIEGEPLWSKYSTSTICHTLDVYSKFTFPYPYPVAISVNGPVGGMEYPMICFNGPRPEEDGTYSARTKYGLISVIIHEVGHNWFPMVVNSDERQWTWMDEGLNSFVQYLAEQEWEEDYPSRSGEPRKIVGYMASADQMPIMTNSESILQFGRNAYAKPATAL